MRIALCLALCGAGGAEYSRQGGRPGGRWALRRVHRRALPPHVQPAGARIAAPACCHACGMAAAVVAALAYFTSCVNHQVPLPCVPGNVDLSISAARQSVQRVNHNLSCVDQRHRNTNAASRTHGSRCVIVALDFEELAGRGGDVIRLPRHRLRARWRKTRPSSCGWTTRLPALLLSQPGSQPRATRALPPPRPLVCGILATAGGSTRTGLRLSGRCPVLVGLRPCVQHSFAAAR